MSQEGTRLTIPQMKRMEDMERELKARGEILAALRDAGSSWMGWVDWRRRLRDFAEDGEQHHIERLGMDREYIYITLYADGDFYTAYFDDAQALWSQAEDDLPMFHVLAKGTPHRTCIHALHLHRWLSHLAATCQPVRIMSHEDLEQAPESDE